MQPATKGIGIAQIYLDHLHAQLVHLFGLIHLGFLDADGFRVKHQHVHRQPHAGIAQRRRGVMRGLRGIYDLPAVLLEHLALFIGQAAARVVQDQPRAQRCEGGIDMDGIGIAGEIHRMHTMIGEMAAQPFDTFQIGGKAMLHHQIAAKAQNIGGVKQRLFFGGDKEFLRRPFQTLFDADFLAQVIGAVIGIGQARLGRAFVAEIWIFVEIFLHQRAVVQIFEPPATIRHGGFQHFRAHRQQHIARRHAAKLAVGVEIRRGDRQRMIDTGGPINTNAAICQLFCKSIQQFIGPVDCLLRAPPPLAAHIAVFGHFGVQRGLFRRDVAIIGPAHDDMFQRVPFIPAVYNSLFHFSSCSQQGFVPAPAAPTQPCQISARWPKPRAGASAQTAGQKKTPMRGSVRVLRLSWARNGPIFGHPRAQVIRAALQAMKGAKCTKRHLGPHRRAPFFGWLCWGLAWRGGQARR